MRRLLLVITFALIIGSKSQLRSETLGPLLPGVESAPAVELVSPAESLPTVNARSVAKFVSVDQVAQTVEFVPPPVIAVDPESVVPDGARYFVLVFGSESVPKRARYTHTWATMVKATPDPMRPDAYELEVQTISWMPRNLVIRPLALRPECGVNLSLEDTLHDCFCKGERVCVWGPFEFDPAVAPAVYHRVSVQINRLNSGCVLYKCIDPDDQPRASYISDCIHAVTDLDRNLPRPFYNEFQNFGMDASRRVVAVLASRDRFDPTITHHWVADALNLDPRVHRATFR